MRGSGPLAILLSSVPVVEAIGDSALSRGLLGLLNPARGRVRVDELLTPDAGLCVRSR